MCLARRRNSRTLLVINGIHIPWSGGENKQMIRLGIFLLGCAMLLVGAASNFQSIPLPIDCGSIECSIGSAVFTLDVVLMIVGVFFILIAFIFHRLAQ